MIVFKNKSVGIDTHTLDIFVEVIVNQI
jgi:hypothetical protein